MTEPPPPPPPPTTTTPVHVTCLLFLRGQVRNTIWTVDRKKKTTTTTTKKKQQQQQQQNTQFATHCHTLPAPS